MKEIELNLYEVFSVKLKNLSGEIIYEGQIRVGGYKLKKDVDQPISGEIILTPVLF